MKTFCLMWCRKLRILCARVYYVMKGALHALCSCVVCARECTGTLCKTCAATCVPYTTCGKACKTCGGLIHGHNACSFCSSVRTMFWGAQAVRCSEVPPILRMFSTWLYDEHIRRVFLAYKKEGVHIVSYALVHAVYHTMVEALGAHRHEGVCIVPVPPHPDHKQELGFHHTAAIAKHLAFLLRCNYAAVLSHRHSRRQKELGFAERWSNMRNALQLKRHAHMMVRNVEVLVLFDDVITTGATIYTAYELVQRAFPDVLVIGVSISRVKHYNE